jgi:hypothetical protein
MKRAPITAESGTRVKTPTMLPSFSEELSAGGAGGKDLPNLGFQKLVKDDQRMQFSEFQGLWVGRSLTTPLCWFS